MRIMVAAAVLTFVAGAAWGGTKGFVSAYDAVKNGRESTAKADGLVMQSNNGAVRIVDAIRPAPPQPAERPPDASLTNGVERMFRTDVDVDPKQVKVETHDGVVKLSGTVKSPHAAEAAIRLALDTDGVAAVDSTLDWRRR